jgi:PAS domain S-box-containing protein
MTTTPPNSNDMKSSIEIPPQKTDENAKISRYAVISAVLWTLLLSGLFVIHVVDNNQAVYEIGHSMVQASSEKDVLFRRWADRHGGVYVPESTVTPANPYLSHIPERDITTPSGRRLTLINPAYMTRQIFELTREKPNMPQGHITSLNSIRPENAPDAWETRALKTLEQGAKEVVEPVLMNGEPHLRFMRQLTTEKSCLSCHAAQGYKEGDSRGGISVTLSLAPIQKAMNKEIQHEAFINLFIWLLGLGFIWFGARKIVRTMKLLQDEQSRLHESEEKYRNLFNNAEVGIFRSRLDGSENLDVNQKFIEMLGMTPEEVIGKPSVVLWADPKEREEMVRRLIADGRVSGFEYKMQNQQSGVRNCLTSVVFYREEGILEGTILDITELKQAEEEKQSLVKQLHQAQKLESLGVLAGGIAHDFNNILAVIICNCSLAMQRPKMAEELIPEIETAAQRAAGLCRQMLAYAGKAQFVESHVDVTALLDDMLSMLKSTLPQNVTIKPYLSGDIPSIKADASQIRQIVMNLIINASEAIGEDQGDIVVSLTKTTIGAEQPEKDHLGKTITDGPYICLEITDTGCGMDDETKRRIFEPFYTTKFVGRGLGMSAVLGIITSHKGALQFTSQPGHGTTFKVYLPVQNGESCVESLQQTTPAPWQGSGTILLVEDEPQLIAVAKTLLEVLGFSVIEASNGIEAIKQFRKNAEEIRLVLTDIGMPRMGGYELIAELKKINPELPIVVSSGFGDTVVTSKIAPGDIAGLISKPYNFDQLREVLKGVVEGTYENAAELREYI